MATGFLVVSVCTLPRLDAKGAVRKGKWQERRAGSPRPLTLPELVTGSGQSGGLAWRTTVLGGDESLHRASAHIQHMGK